MATRCLHLPYKASSPRSVRGAHRQGWAVVPAGWLPHAWQHQSGVSWLGLNIWCETHCAGYWLSSRVLSEFAFENAADATLFSLKWG